MYPWENADQCGQGGRMFVVPVDDPDLRGGGSQPLASATFELRLRDVLDFTVDFSTWLAANGSNARIVNAVWEVAPDSPKTPILPGRLQIQELTLVGGSKPPNVSFSATGRCVVVVQAAADAKVGDGYWLDLKVTVGATTATHTDDVALPERTLVRRIAIIVVAG